MKETVLVTGAQGCIGAWVTKQLLDRGAEVISYDQGDEHPRLPLIAPGLDRSALRSEIGKIEDTARIKDIVKSEGVTKIVHLAAVLMPFCQKDPIAGGMINVIGTLNVFEAAREAGREVRVAYASSSAVWGPPTEYAAKGRSLNEDDVLKPATHYGVFKQANEGNARAYYRASGITSFGLRPWTVYGPGRDTGLTAAPTIAMQAVARGEKYEMPVSGRMDLQYVEDVAAAFLDCLFSPHEGAFVYNLAGDIVHMADIVREIEAVKPSAAGLVTFAGQEVPVAVDMDDSAIRAAIPELKKTPLAEGIRRTIAAYERQAAQ
ncbi:NAD-dependent epimerase/dehydratase family protein [Bryobacter aggregatus]|uniref:NAD-dependent epimerase/dehydratase family protein n=1 Tax=Bryobacter aggregatus TaxID=360054 RepID=UPI0004E25DED|nr:SDR family oxidoreductase [Bryobacter aggregatus]